MSGSEAILADYQIVKGIGMALAVLAFFMGLAKAGATEMPNERARGQDLLLKAGVSFILLAGDGMIARGLVTWFGLPASALPVFWQ